MANVMKNPKFDQLKILKLLSDEDDLDKVLDEFEKLRKSRVSDTFQLHYAKYEQRKKRIDQLNQSGLYENDIAQRNLQNFISTNSDSEFFLRNDELKNELNKLIEMKQYEIDVMRTSIKIDFVKKALASIRQQKDSMSNRK